MPDTDNLLTIQQVAQMHPGTAGKSAMHRNSVFRWIKKGICGVHLRTVTRGGRRFIRQSDLEAFHDEIANRKSHGKVLAEEIRDTEAAEKELSRMLMEGALQ